MDGHYRLDALADDVRRLRRHLAPLVDEYESTYTAALVERIALHLEALYLDRREPAALRYRRLADEGVDEDEALELALAEVDREATEVRQRLGPRPRPRGKQA